MRPVKKELFLNYWEDTRKASENREDTGKFESGHMFANNQHGAEGFQTKSNEVRTPEKRSSPTTSCILVQTCDQYHMVIIIPFLLGGTDGSTTLL